MSQPPQDGTNPYARPTEPTPGPPQGYGYVSQPDVQAPHLPPPYGPTPYPQTPNVPNPYVQAPNGQPPGGPTSPTSPAPPTNGSKRPLIIGGAVLALIIVVVGVAVAAGTGKDTSTSGGSAPASSTPVAQKPSDAVQGFLEALAANDAAKALGYTDKAPVDKTFITDAVLKQSSALAPMTAISVPEVTDQSAYEVVATYRLGGRAQSKKFYVTRPGDDWKVSEIVGDLDLSYFLQRTLPTYINGVRVTTDTVTLLPGTYAFTTGSRWVGYGSSNTMTVTDGHPFLDPKIKPALTKAGYDTVLAKTRSAFRACLAQHKLRPKGCPNHIDDTLGVKIKESTVRWSVKKDPFRNAKFDLDYDDPTSATGTFNPDYQIRYSGTKNGRSGTGSGDVFGLFSFEAIADLSKPTVTVVLR